jgi:hypothetical protein
MVIHGHTLTDLAIGLGLSRALDDAGYAGKATAGV